MRDPEKLRVAIEAEEVAVLVYRLTRDFPKSEIFGLTAQMRGAAVSIGSNIWEGCGRSSDRAFIPFLHTSVGSANELLFQLRIAGHEHYGPEDVRTTVRERVD